MVILLFLIFIILFRIKKVSNSKDKKYLVIILLSGLFINILALFFLQIQTSKVLKYTVGSDSFYYYNTALFLLKNPEYLLKFFNKFAGGYIIFCYFILKTSFFHSPVLIKIANLLLFSNIIVLLYSFLNYIKLSKKNIWLALILISINGSIIWTNIRILKDILFVYLAFEVIYSFIICIEKYKYVNLVKIIFILYWISHIRPYSQYLLLIIIIYMFFMKYLTKKNKTFKIAFYILLFFLLIVLITIQANYFQIIIKQELYYSNITAMIGAESVKSKVISFFNKPLYIRVPLGIIRFVLLPTPVGILQMQETYFIHKMLILSSSTIWFMIFFYIFLYFLFYYNAKNTKWLKPLIFFSLAIILSYSFLYMGSAEARTRISMYIVGTILGTYAFTNISYNKNLFLISFSVLFLIFINFISILL